MAIGQLLKIPTFLILALATPFSCGAQVPGAPDKSIPLEDSAQRDFVFAFSNDGLLLAAGRRFIRVWDTGTGRTKMKLSVSAIGLAFSPDAMMLAGAISGPTNDAAIWALTDAAQQQIAQGGFGSGSGNLIRRFNQTNRRRITLSAALSPDMKLLAIGNGDETITLWELATGKEITLNQENSYGAAIGFSHDGKYLASGGRDGTIHVWEVATRSEKYCLKGYPGRVEQVAFCDHDRLTVATAVAGDKTNVFVNRFPDGKELARFPDSYNPILTADGRFLGMIGSDSKTVCIQDLSKQSRIFERRVEDNNQFKAIAFAPNGRLICVQSGMKQLSLLNLHTGIAEK